MQFTEKKLNANIQPTLMLKNGFHNLAKLKYLRSKARD